ncbi:hypothetical protein NLI96_g6003 [Meripilus lineatus]|uniref:ACB domain-containing protein n=1 Tax=Meripilus lineatus TaxID=2056292 RepID=A0AAD5YDD4_9APHY|nr:hypothetical protein NLI96_g6003 [Physisporinus lineatus]
MSKSQFEKAVAIVQGLPKDGPIQPSQDEQLFFYKYYKQATIGDVNVSRPGLLDFTGKANEEAYKQYVDKLIEILNKAGTDEAKAQIAEIEAA